MSILWLAREEIPSDQNDVRNTATPVLADDPPAEYAGPPQVGEFETYSEPRLGMSRRDMAGDYTPSVKAAPSDLYDDNHLYTDRIDAQVATSGTAAKRERRGFWGHGSMAISRAIEPVRGLSEGGRLSNDYFAVNKRPIQDGSSQAVKPPTNYDPDAGSAQAAAAKKGSREAIRADYAGWFSAMGYKSQAGS